MAVGVAAALAVMESKTIKHGPMEFVFTVEEETTLGGASAFKAGVLKARYLLNLDNEEKGTLCIGCAGGLNTRARRKVAIPGGAARVPATGSRSADSGADTPAWTSIWDAAMRCEFWAERCNC